ncbi:hypothetical protein [Sulfuriroseicoccus oceanibius]|uniref:Uncharacterized protein n=1 Tax=Sulfuriroseicoccus oceanibius TaxID=2707525 RepID=A0A6B3L7U3_9BACT|nr:hypothetical protein [Sulfuriroseicoccus oceanibius]QQL44074.1 hypothetical protein G3M56_009225 [Sulfuriroseicoccus oceanibius]
MNEQPMPQSISGSGLLVLTICAFVMLFGSVFFAVSNGYPGHPTAQISSLGLIVNLPASVIAWIAFARGTRRGLLQMGLAIALLTAIHYLLISNLWTVAFHGG